MTYLLKALLSLSLSGTLLILLFFLLKPLWKDRFSRQWQYYIWLIVIARLLLPFAPEANLVGTVFQHLDASVPSLEQSRSESPDMDYDETQEPSEDESPQNADRSNLTAALDAIPLPTYLFFIWLVIAFILFVRKITIYQSFARYVKAGQTPVDDIDTLNQFSLSLSKAGIRRNIEIATNPLITSPLLMGFRRPCIVLPDVALPDTDFSFIIQHELTHYMRRDLYYKWLVQLVICLHWFNPFVYLMGREINRACELSCDEVVIRNMDANEKAAYGDTLLNAMGTGGSYKSSLASVTLHESKGLLKERLRAIMKFKTPSKSKS